MGLWVRWTFSSSVGSGLALFVGVGMVGAITKLFFATVPPDDWSQIHNGAFLAIVIILLYGALLLVCLPLVGVAVGAVIGLCLYPVVRRVFPTRPGWILRIAAYGSWAVPQSIVLAWLLEWWIHPADGVFALAWGLSVGAIAALALRRPLAIPVQATVRRWLQLGVAAHLLGALIGIACAGSPRGYFAAVLGWERASLLRIIAGIVLWGMLYGALTGLMLRALAREVSVFGSIEPSQASQSRPPR